MSLPKFRQTPALNLVNLVRTYRTVPYRFMRLVDTSTKFSTTVRTHVPILNLEHVYLTYRVP
eukprot:SAG31_NODE_22620_length_521_cov_1.736967_1_plen_61_part_10